MNKPALNSGSPERTAQTQGDGFGDQGKSDSSSPTPRARPREGAETIKAISELIDQGAPEAQERPARADSAGERAESVLDGRGRFEEDEDEDEGQPPPKARQKPRNVLEAAELLGITPDEFYALEVGIGDGTTAKLGTVKDGHIERAGLEREIAEKQGHLDEREGAVRGAETRLVEVFELAKEGLSPGTQAQIGQYLNQQREAREAREIVALRRAIPEISDPEFMKRFDSFILEAGQEFGFSPRELAEMRDHRMFLVLKRVMDQKNRLERLTRARPKPEAAPGVMSPSGRGTGRQDAVARAKRTGKEADVVRGISELIRGR